MRKPFAFLRVMRPAHWAKNVFVAAPLAFAPDVLTLDNVLRTGAAAICFCLMASAVYALNDWRDRDADRRHPSRRTRPLAQREVTEIEVLWLAAALAAFAVMGATPLTPVLTGLLVAYGILNVSYSFGLKAVPVAGPAVIVAGFLLRVGAGAVVIGIPPSPWILLMTALLAALLVVGKHRADVAVSSPGTARIFDVGLYGLAIAGLVFFAAYGWLGPQPKTLFSLPLVVLGLGRYLQRVVVHECRQGPTELILSDRLLMPTIAAWTLQVMFAVHG